MLAKNTMKLNGTHIIASPRARVWAALNNPEVLQACIPGCESLTRKSETEFDADVVAKVGPVKAKFKTVVTLENIDAPISYTLVGSSRAGAAGFGKGKADVRLEDTDDGGTELSYVADFKVGGKLAQIGSRLVAGATKKTADDFFGSLSERLDAGALETDREGRREPAKRWPYRLVAAIVAIALLWWLLSA